MSDADQLAYLKRVLALTDQHDDHDLWWHVDAAGVVRFSVNCNDLFEWACADAEEIAPGNVGALEQAYADAKASCPFGHLYAKELFVARVRGCRPQHAAYPKPALPGETAADLAPLWALFDAAGPPREVDHSNPRPHPASAPPAKPVEG